MLAENSDGLKHLQIAWALHVLSSRHSGILLGLVRQEFLLFDQSMNWYFLGPKNLVLAGNILKGLDIASASRPIDSCVLFFDALHAGKRKNDHACLKKNAASVISRIKGFQEKTTNKGE